MFAFLLPLLAKKTSRPTTHLICLVAGGLGLISFFLFKDKYLLILSMAGIGLAWSSILSMTYSMLTASLPSNKMGVYMGIFNFFIVIPQILAATLLGFFTKHFFNGNLGELTGEMGTVVTYRGAEIIFKRSLLRLESRLKDSAYCGYNYPFAGYYQPNYCSTSIIIALLDKHTTCSQG